MKQQFEDYITRSREIRSLSMPPEETEAHIGEIYRLFNENFARALANTRTLEMVDVQLAWLILRDLYYISWTRSTCFRVPFSMRNLT